MRYPSPEIPSEKSCGFSWWGRLTGSRVRSQTDLQVRLQIRIARTLLCPSLFTLWPDRSFPCHHITSITTNWSKCKVEKAVAYHSLCPRIRKRTNKFVWKLLVTTDVCEMLCFVVSNAALLVRVEIRASHPSTHPNDWPHRVSVCLGFSARTLESLLQQMGC